MVKGKVFTRNIIFEFVALFMKYWLVHHSWESFRRTQEYCGFVKPAERDKISVSDKIVYFGNGLVFGVFEVIKKVDNEFNEWERSYPFQIKIKPLEISNNPTKGINARVLQDKIGIQKAKGSSPNLVELTENEFNQIKQVIEKGEKELKFT